MTNLIFFSLFKGCNVDLSVGIDLSTPTRQVQQRLQGLLPELMQELAMLSNISCGVPGQTNVMLRYLVPGLKGQLIFDSGFEKYSDEAIQKFLIHQAASSNHMDADFLHSLGNNAIRLSSARVKVINAENPCCGTIRQWEGYSFCD